MSNPDDDKLVHDILPLVRDAATGEIRFGRLGVDDPATFITDVAGLPDAEMTLRLFDSRNALACWLHGARLFAGNATTFVVPGEDELNAIPVVLALRFDRDRAQGDTVDQAVAFEMVGYVHDAANLRSRMAHSRSRALEDGRNRATSAIWKAEWKVELDALKDAGASLSSRSSWERDQQPGGPLHVEWRDPDRKDEFHGMGRDIRFARRDGALVAGCHLPIQHQLGDDLVKRRDGRRVELGFTLRGAYLEMPVEALDDAALGKVGAAMEDYERHETMLNDIQRGRDLVAAVRADPRIMQVMKQVSAGYFVVRQSRGTPAGQLSPKSLTVQSVSNTRIQDMASRGLLKVLWNGEFPKDWTYGPVTRKRRPDQFVGLSDYGRAVIDGDQEVAEALALRAYEQRTRTNLLWDTYEPADPAPAFQDALSHLDEQTRATLAERTLAALGDAFVNDGPLWRSTEEVWALAAAAMGAGALSVDPSTGAARVEEPAQGPRP